MKTKRLGFLAVMLTLAVLIMSGIAYADSPGMDGLPKISSKKVMGLRSGVTKYNVLVATNGDVSLTNTDGTTTPFIAGADAVAFKLRPGTYDAIVTGTGENLKIIFKLNQLKR